MTLLRADEGKVGGAEGSSAVVGEVDDHAVLPDLPPHPVGPGAAQGSEASASGNGVLRDQGGAGPFRTSHRVCKLRPCVVWGLTHRLRFVLAGARLGALP